MPASALPGPGELSPPVPAFRAVVIDKPGQLAEHGQNRYRQLFTVWQDAMIRIQEILDKVAANNHDANLELIQKAYVFAATAHAGQTRLSGEPYLSHPLAVAYTLADMGFDEPTVAAGLLHDTVEDTGTTIEEIDDKFGEDVAARYKAPRMPAPCSAATSALRPPSPSAVCIRRISPPLQQGTGCSALQAKNIIPSMIWTQSRGRR